MKFKHTAIILAALFVFRHSGVAQQEAVLIQSVKSKLAKVNNYQADGLMKIDVSFIKAPDSRVKIYYKRPDQFAIKKETGISILPKGGIQINLSSLLSEENYTVVPAGETMMEGKKVKIIKLLPARENSDIVVTSLYVEEKELLIRKSIVTTRDNGTYEMEMKYGKYSNWGLPDTVLFTFNIRDYKLPKGMTFEYENGGDKPKDAPGKNKKGKIEIDYSSYIINKGVADAVFR